MGKASITSQQLVCRPDNVLQLKVLSTGFGVSCLAPREQVLGRVPEEVGASLPVFNPCGCRDGEASCMMPRAFQIYTKVHPTRGFQSPTVPRGKAIALKLCNQPRQYFLASGRASGQPQAEIPKDETSHELVA